MNKKNSAFTLIELLVVMAILASLISLAAVAAIGITKRAMKTSSQVLIWRIDSGIKKFRAQLGRLPNYDGKAGQEGCGSNALRLELCCEHEVILPPDPIDPSAKTKKIVDTIFLSNIKRSNVEGNGKNDPYDKACRASFVDAWGMNIDARKGQDFSKFNGKNLLKWIELESMGPDGEFNPDGDEDYDDLSNWFIDQVKETEE